MSEKDEFGSLPRYVKERNRKKPNVIMVVAVAHSSPQTPAIRVLIPRAIVWKNQLH